MNTGMGNFARVSPNMAELLKAKTLKNKLFEVGEVIQVKACNFQVHNIGRHTLTLRLIPDDLYQQVPERRKK